ncbi:hypothetical protein B0H17DRAFT_86354 [Mycena rosella]|uniref:Uncharacterized protein n=1 Tax=Mycena rosella TaxID=1033263 RepID=A0AAD7E0G5_MYCRO|nr:hypothetical protein B0H17DRAFT_86354 [Mycena rosella]
MAAIQHTDKPEFGRRNRNDDSSSSRESSPIRKHKRSFSPTSDDEVVISIADDDTPPPEGPLIRQAVAFSWTPSIPTAPASINTYQASPIPKQSHFLPGQEVPAPPPPPKPPKIKKKSAPRFSSQTNRFRINSYDPTPSTAPALTSGDGPYASMYRADAASFNVTDAGGSIGSEPPPEAASTGSRKKPKPSDSRPKASTSKAKVTTSKAKSSASKRKASNPDQGSSGQSKMALKAVSEQEGSSQNSYYRQDYEQSNVYPSSSHSTFNSVVEDAPSPRESPRQLPASKRTNIPTRLVTILIEDMRGDVADPQLVEVRVVLRDSEDTVKDGYWANAEDICKTLQASPSRIDGPAKVYALRGKYRHLILKVTADNVDELVTANVVVNPDRTLDVIVETGLPPAMPPRAQRQFSESDRFMSPQAVVQFPHVGAGARFPTPQEHGSRKRRRSPPHDLRASSRQWSPSTLASSPRGSPSRGPSTSYQTSLNTGTPDARMQFPTHHPAPPPNRYSPERFKPQDPSGTESSESEDEADIHASVSEEVDKLIQDEPSWTDYFRVSAKPRSAPVVLKEYAIVQGFVDNWVGKPVPSGALIEKSHIAQALQIEEQDRARYMLDCGETLRLMALYGPEGQRLQDPEVVEKANDDSDPAYNTKPIKRLLKLLRQVDDRWVAANP